MHSVRWPDAKSFAFRFYVAGSISTHDDDDDDGSDRLGPML